MTLAIIAIGAPGTGKTTVLKPLAEQYGLVYINRDDIRQELWGDATDQSKNKEVWEEATRRTHAALSSGRSVVLDSTFVELWKRKDALALVREAGATRVIGVVADIDEEEAQRRNSLRDRKVPAHVISWMYEQLEKESPQLDEGFDVLYPLSAQEKIQRELEAV
jgi:predicted kinase